MFGRTGASNDIECFGLGAISSNLSLFVKVRVQSDTALLLINVAIVFPRSESETCEVAWHRVLGLGLVSGCVKNSGLEAEAQVIVEAGAEVRLALRLFQETESAHLRAIVRAAGNFRGDRELELG